MPLLPPSDEPTASVIMMLGRRAKNWSFTGALKSAAEETTAKRRREVVVDSGIVERLDQRFAHGVPGDHDGVDPFFLHQVPDLRVGRIWP